MTGRAVIVKVAEVWPAGMVRLAERRNNGSILYKEDIADGQVTDDPAVVADVALRFKSLQLEGLPNGDSRDLIARMAEEV